MTRLLILLAVLAATAGPANAANWRPNPRAEALYRQAVSDLARNTFETRRRALGALEQATLLDPGHPEYELLLARTYFSCGFLKLSQRRFERVTRLAPDDAEGHFGLGQVWRRDWLKFLETPSLDRAIEQFSAAARLKPGQCDAWLQLVPLLVARGKVPAAASAAARAVEADPRRPEALLARAHTAYRGGDVALADSLFHAAVPRLPRLARERFEDISPVASERDTFTLHRLPIAEQREFVARFWRANDPDLASPENEALMEYWSRVAQAYFLYFDPKRREWDERGEVYVRYGPPDSVVYNPVGERLSVHFGTGPEYPANMLVWHYPDLGMTVHMQDRLLSEYYLLPITLDHDPDPAPNPDSLARRTDRLAVGAGRGVFPTLPPGVRPIEVHGQVACFLAERGPRLSASVDAPGGPADSARAEWAIVDTAGLVVARGSRSLAPSACEPAERRVADFATDLPPGRYLVGLTVRDGAARRGIYRSEVVVPVETPPLALSDVVITCGTPAPGERGPLARLEPNPQASVTGASPVTAYFEIYHLTPDSTGQSRFEYEYTIRSGERDARIWLQRLLAPRPRIPAIAVSREAENVGRMRRQFVSVPIQSLPSGRYRLDITVRDLIAGAEATRSALFVKAAGELRN